MSPGSEGLAIAALEGDGWEGVGLAVASGATLVLEATEELSQPFPPMATAASKKIITRFISAISSLLRQPSPCLLPNPPERRAQYGIAYGIPSATEPSPVRLDSRSSDHAVARASSRILEDSAHQKVLLPGVCARLCPETFHIPVECNGWERVQF